MQLSNETLQIIKNFAAINQGIEFKTGHRLKTCSTNKGVFAEAKIKEAFPEDFCIYDLNQFLSVYSLFKDVNPDLSFDTSNVIFRQGKRKLSYRKAAKEMIVTSDKELKLTDVNCEFTLTAEDYDCIMKSANVLSSPYIAVEAEGGKIYLVAFDAKNDSAHINSIEVGETDNDKSFRYVFDTSRFRMLAGTYDVRIGLFAHFKNKSIDLEYWVAMDGDYSRF